jgi:hypothetical protein
MAKGASVKGAPAVRNQAFALGTRPQSLRAQPALRIKPAAASTTQYGKGAGAAPQQPNPAGASFGNTGLTNLS